MVGGRPWLVYRGRLGRGHVGIGHARVAQADALAAAKLGIPALAVEEGERGHVGEGPGRAGGSYDVLVGNGDAVWRAGVADHAAAFAGACQWDSSVHPHQEVLGTYRQWCFLTKMLNWVPQMGQYVTSESGCQRGRTTSGGMACSVGLGDGMGDGLVAMAVAGG